MNIERRQLIAGAGAFLVLGPAAAQTKEHAMYGLIVKMTAQPGKRDALAAILAEGVAGMPGCLAYVNACIRSTIHGSFARGYDTVLVSDAHTTGDHSEWGAPPPAQVIAHTNLYWTYQTGPGKTAGTRKTGEVDFGKPDGP